MLITVYFFFINIIMPQLGAYAEAVFEPIMLIIITLTGMIILLGTVGIKVSNNLGSTIVGGFFMSVGYLCRTLFKALGWIISNTCKLIPKVFNESRNVFSQIGINTAVSNILAIFVVVAFVAVII